MRTQEKVFQAYRAFHEQGFVPIFTEDGFDARLLVEGCVEAGLQAIEYTLRRRDAPEMIAWVRKNYPDLHIFAGSTLDDDCLAHRARVKNPQVRTVAELADLGVDGFVSATGWSLDNIRAWSETHVIAPTAMTITEAMQQLGAGAHFIKMQGSDLDLVSRCRQSNTFDICPVLVTGGMNKDRIPAAVRAGGVVFGAGFDVLLKGESKPTTARIAEAVRTHVDVVQRARAERWPELASAGAASPADWLDRLPHTHNFLAITAHSTVGC